MSCSVFVIKAVRKWTKKNNQLHADKPVEDKNSWSAKDIKLKAPHTVNEEGLGIFFFSPDLLREKLTVELELCRSSRLDCSIDYFLLLSKQMSFEKCASAIYMLFLTNRTEKISQRNLLAVTPQN